jgi:hypothetical protein
MLQQKLLAARIKFSLRNSYYGTIWQCQLTDLAIILRPSADKSPQVHASSRRKGRAIDTDEETFGKLRLRNVACPSGLQANRFAKPDKTTDRIENRRLRKGTEE